MKITFVGHASILVETEGVSILSDPWWRGPCFGAQWWTYPRPDTRAVEARPPDYIYISHGHHDHLHPSTLSTLARDATVLVSSRIGIAASIRQLGFEVVEVDDDEAFEVPGVKLTCRIMETYGGDTLMTLSDGHEVVVNLNDALHAAPERVQQDFVRRLRSLHSKIDYVFCGYGVASHFPNCYVIPGKDREATAARRQQYFNGQWARLIDGLNPRFGFPFAADVVFLEEDLFWSNSVTHNTERPTDRFRAMHPKSTVTVMDIAPGFTTESGHIIDEKLRAPLSAKELRRDCAAEIERAQRSRPVDDAGVESVVELLRSKIEACAEHLLGYEHDYRFLIRFRRGERGIRIEKKYGAVQVEAADASSGGPFDLIYTTRFAYLKTALTRPYGDEVLFVGSGGVFEYARQEAAKRNLHRELMCLLKPAGSPAPARPSQRAGVTSRAKQMIKRLIGRVEADLYDLGAWTVFESTDA